jgi:hypothetical protein
MNRTAVALALGALVLIGLSAYLLADAHSGEAARVEVIGCQHVGKGGTSCTGVLPVGDVAMRLVPVPKASWTDVGHQVDLDDDGHTVPVTVAECHDADGSLTCTGVSPPSPTPLGTIEVRGASFGEIGRILGVRIHRGDSPYARATGDRTPYVYLAFGCVMAVCVPAAAGRHPRRWSR